MRVWIILLAVLILAGVAWRFAKAGPTPEAGSAAPDFTLPSQDGSQVSLKDFRGKWVVLYFYPKDFTSGCTVEAHNFQRDQSEYARRNAVVIGVSVDNAESHKQFCAKEGLNFKLLADTGHKRNKPGTDGTFPISNLGVRRPLWSHPPAWTFGGGVR
jgi:peroxiredoxin Q/BCP